jgi:hypothetical protein
MNHSLYEQYLGRYDQKPVSSGLREREKSGPGSIQIAALRAKNSSIRYSRRDFTLLLLHVAVHLVRIGVPVRKALLPCSRFATFPVDGKSLIASHPKLL